MELPFEPMDSAQASNILLGEAGTAKNAQNIQALTLYVYPKIFMVSSIYYTI